MTSLEVPEATSTIWTGGASCTRRRPLPAQAARQLRLEERGTSGDLSDLVVRCECGKSRRLATGACPWMGNNAGEPCGQPVVSSSAPPPTPTSRKIVSVLSLPDPASAVRGTVVELAGTT